MGDETGIFDLFNTSLIFWQLVTFAILLFLLIRYVFPPIQNMINDRQRRIEQAIDEAQRTRSEAQELLAEYRRQLDEARSESRRILDESRRQAEAQRERTKQEAREEGDRIIARAREEIGRERENTLRQVRGEVADMVLAATGRVINRKLDREEHDRLIQEALNDLDSASANGGSGDRSGKVRVHRRDEAGSRSV
ncbi:ATP synthase F0, B subunit [Rubrobacter radiotolerans]|uniref:ATP synthase subunit b n=1 Tax=Rubrobacter radiotolerans TaxID=42256 RepID=A0A023X3U3_RUBRA|nr:F0F1 ATP synthase subunit B [Rubrobacter radiotolerans]AHY46866.1 ATP synthase F0, B subunit [Rubrobacter radiotolerans]MDX5894271.1 F0F1 ATP synthase subunit B [Rubrobacter radiotolerans]SMC05612.1 ATP synthase F0 subcomplex B subunit [Rubrobacter radiotolerans DSM 5868]